MDAKEAKRLTDLNKRLNFIYGEIKKEISKPDTKCSIKMHIKEDEKEALKKQGYSISDHIDDDSDYRGTWIGWGHL